LIFELQQNILICIKIDRRDIILVTKNINIIKLKRPYFFEHASNMYLKLLEAHSTKRIKSYLIKLYRYRYVKKGTIRNNTENINLSIKTYT